MKKREFVNAEWNGELNDLKPIISGENPASINEEIPALLMPVHELTEKMERIIVRTKTTENIKGLPRILPKKIGVLVIELDKNVIENKILPDLAKKYFSENESADYKLSVVDKNNKAVFQTGEVGEPDASVKLFNLSPDKFMFFANRDILPKTSGEPKKNVVLNQVQSEKRTTRVLTDKREEEFDVQIFSSEKDPADVKPRINNVEGQTADANGVWTLNVQHSAGSLEQFITNTRNKNLGISFGILSLARREHYFDFYLVAARPHLCSTAG